MTVVSEAIRKAVCRRCGKPYGRTYGCGRCEYGVRDEDRAHAVLLALGHEDDDS